MHGDNRMHFTGRRALILERERLEGARKWLFVLTGILLSNTDEGRVEFAEYSTFLTDVTFCSCEGNKNSVS